MKIKLILCLFVMIFLKNNLVYSQNNTIKNIGDVSQIALPATALAMTFIKKDKKGLWKFTKSYGTTFIITRILKEAIKKERPGNAWSFDSFPSGHTSSAFSGASFLQRRYGWKYGIPAYALATFTGYSRVYSKNHDFIDVLTGAVIGIGSTYIFTTPYQQKHYQLTFNKNKESYLIGFTYRF